MRKICVLFTMILICFSFAICQALPESEMAVGGITLSASKDIVKGIYGEPTKIEYLKAKYATSESNEMWTYGDSYKIFFLNEYVMSIQTDKNNGITTPAGIPVGSDIRSIFKYYGQNYGEEPVVEKYDGVTYVTYFHDRWHTWELVYGCKNDKVIFINLYNGV